MYGVWNDDYVCLMLKLIHVHVRNWLKLDNYAIWLCRLNARIRNEWISSLNDRGLKDEDLGVYGAKNGLETRKL